PRLWQNLHLEWLWRTLLEPKRLKRISVLPKFMLQVKCDAKR
ncbi:MAG: WecB/TagA/CpsF family glycosyltransferase, partial [Firmicutes bacterium]|nr:WecB/TagA/CpsF family glycosyltransferase [Bacillota bacterium]